MVYQQKHLKQGYYRPINPEKYEGDPNNIVFRSGLELKFYRFFDHNPAIIRWNSEQVIVPYTADEDGKVHRYFVDAWLKVKGKNGVQQYLVEIKPFAFTLEPPQQERKTQTYQRKVFEYIKNLNKWKAADVYAKKKNMKFIILTEKDLP